jgi:hypothetical protein
MKFRILKTTIVSAFLLVSGLAEAGLISHNNYSLNTDTNIVTNNGTEWLQWDVTIGESINSALSKYASEGWMLASNAQMAGLFTDFGWGSSVQEDDKIDTIIDTIGNYSASGDESAMDNFIELFGTTFFFSFSGSNPAGILDQRSASALFGSDLDNDGMFRYALVNSDYYRCTRGSCSELADSASMVSDSFWNIDGNYIIDYARGGVALTRVVDVPAPSTILIFALGLMGLAARRFKKKF